MAGAVVVEVVEEEVPESDLGRYLTPVAGQSDVAPSIPEISVVKRRRGEGRYLDQ